MVMPFETGALRLWGADEQHELSIADAIVAEIVHPAGRVEDHVLWAEALFDRMPRLLPADSDAAFKDKIRVLDRARIAAYSGALRQMDQIHTILAGWSTALAYIDQSGEFGVPDRPALDIAHDMPCELLLARIVAIGIEDASFPWRSTETPALPPIAVTRLADTHRR